MKLQFAKITWKIGVRLTEPESHGDTCGFPIARWVHKSHRPCLLNGKQGKLVESPVAAPQKCLAKRTQAQRCINKFPAPDQFPAVQPVLLAVDAVAILSKLATDYEMYIRELDKYKLYENELRRKHRHPNLQSNDQTSLGRSQALFTNESRKTDVHGKFRC